MGTLTDLGIIGDDTAEANTRVAFRQEVVDAMRTGEVLLFGMSIASPGGPIPLGVGMAPLLLDMAAQGLEDYPEDFESQTADVMIEGYKLVDNIPASNLLKPMGVTDWTFPLLPIVNFILKLLALLKVPNPPEWVLENIPKITKRAKEFGEAVTALSTCDGSKLAKLLSEIDPSIDKNEAQAELEKPIGDTGKKICELIPTLELPPFGLPPLPAPFIQPWTWPAFKPPGFPIPPAEIPLPIFNPSIPAIGWSPDIPTINWMFELKIIPAILAAVQKIIDKMAEAIQYILEGVAAFIAWLIETLIELIVLPILEALGDLIRKFVMLAAIIAVFIKNMIASLVVSIVGLLLGAGFFAWGAAYTLGLLPE